MARHDTGGTAAAPPAASPPGTRPPGAGPPGAGVPGAGVPVAGPADAGPPDAGPPEAGPPEARPPGAEPPGAGVPGEVRLVVRAVPGDADPADVLRCFAGDRRVAFLSGRWAGGGALLASEPVATLGPDEDPFAALSRQPVVTGLPPGSGEAVGGGWFGSLGYPLARRIEPVPPWPEQAPRPPALLGWYDHVLRRDAGGRWTFEALWTPERAAELDRRHELLAARLHDAAHPDRLPRLPAPRATPLRGPARAVHLAAVERAVRHIRAGELFQVNVCLRLAGRFTGSVVELHARAVQRLRPAYGALLTDAAGGLACLSPEQFLVRRGRQVGTEPIKGTRPRTGVDDAAQAGRLARSTKDAAENVMIVDLVRNDLGRVCRPGSVRVPSLLRVEAHPGVWHLVSRVEGELAAGIGDGELLRAVFPPGSVTGAPKVRAMEVIREVEGAARDAYTGVIGFASPVRGLELNVTIRTFEVAGGTIRLGVGGGITVDSVPVEEWRECFVKAAPLLAAAGLRLEADPAPRPAARPGPAMRLPDPAAGLLETVPVRDRRPVGLHDHLARLDRSCREVYGVGLPDGPAGAGWPEWAAVGHGAVRVAAAPDGTGGLRLTVTPAGPRPAAGALHLVPMVRPAGPWRHAWADRRWADDAEAAAGPGRSPLLLDAAGTVCETTRGCLLLVEAGRLVTRPLDDDVLPGVTRLLVLDEAVAAGVPVAVEPVPLERLLAADAVLSAGSRGGVEQVAAVGARRWAAPHPLAAELADLLDRRRSPAAPARR